MQIANAITPIAYDRSFDCIPRLRVLTPELPVPSKAAVDDGDPAVTSCIFDVTGGIFFGRATEAGAAFAMLQTETDGPPRVRISGTTETFEIHVRPGGEMTIANLGPTEEHDGSYDFYLHYKLAANIPEGELGIPGRAQCPTNVPGGKTWPSNFKTVDAGCSNSGYP